VTEKTDRERGKPDEQRRSVWEEAHDLIRRLEGTTVQRLAIETGDFKVEIERGASVAAAPAQVGAPAASAPGVAATLPAAAEHRPSIVAPLVGTFYRSAQPGAKAFVEEGDVIDQGQPVAIVEAMKIMNQIVADRRGRVAEILCKDGDWVEFEQPLMYLEPIEG
jgi:acetyl-CoA carboxylase biotin carboxyl carrier protein